MAGGERSHLDALEAESIHILRETAAQFRAPVMLYSIGKDSSVLLHLAMKAFFPAKPPFPLLHVDTTWKFRDMIAFRDRRAAELGIDLLVHVNEDGVRDGINPFMWMWSGCLYPPIGSKVTTTCGLNWRI